MIAQRGALLLGLALALPGCALRVTPAAIGDDPSIPPEVARRATQRWYRAVDLANGYLESPFRRTLPRGRFELHELRGLRFVTDDDAWPITVWRSFGGWLVVLVGFRAQERDGGFVVGSAPPDEHDLVDNSMFRRPDGAEYDDAAVADLLLHETAHVVHREGTVGVWNSLAYYLELVFTWRTVDHSAERLPNAVSEEFDLYRRWELARGAGAWDPGPWLEALAAHVAAGGADCRHGLASGPR